jgi:Fe-S-cluster-containing dehydrogenase component
VDKFEIEINVKNCAGCLRCQLACSDHYTKKFNPSAARILVIVSGVDCSIEFTEECNDCGICADHCFYGALNKNPREAA